MTDNEISFAVRGCIFKVYNALGPGLLESAYEAALEYEIEKLGMVVAKQVPMPMIYETVSVDAGYRMDLVVEGKVILEVKSVEFLSNVHHQARALSAPSACIQISGISGKGINLRNRVFNQRLTWNCHELVSVNNPRHMLTLAPGFRDRKYNEVVNSKR